LKCNNNQRSVKAAHNTYNMNTEMTLRETVILRRKEVNMTQLELAEKTGLTQSQLSNFEAGKTSLSSDNLDKVFSVLNIKFSQNAEKLWDLSQLCAKKLKEKGVKDISLITREEMAELSGNEDILLLQVISESLYDKYAACKLINEQNTYNYFISLVKFQFACLK
jgi:Helix-turn-helix.